MGQQTDFRHPWFRIHLLAIVLITLVALSATARAGDFPHERKGPVLGFNFGGGSARFEYQRLGTTFEHELDKAMGGGARLGYGLSDHIVLSLEGHGYSISDDGAEVKAVMALVTVTWYPGGGGFFLRAGGGGGAANIKLIGPPATLDWTERESEGCAGVGLGYEWRLGRQFALGVALDACGLSFADLPGFEQTKLGQGTATLQLNWYL